jgi:hypothetical protein
MAVVAGVVAAGFTVAGCSSASSGSTSADATTTASATTAPASTPAATASPGQAQAAGSGSTCQTADLSYALGAKSGSSGQMTQKVDLTSTGSSACTLSGFPGVDLVGVANGQQNYRWSLERQVVHYAKVTLQPGGTAHFNLIYLPAASGDSTDISVDKLVITPPNDYTQAELTWNQSVLLQDGATRPGTYISPVMPGA